MYMRIQGLDTMLNSLGPKSVEYLAYEELNSVIRSALTKKKLSEVCIDGLSPKKIVKKLNKMHKAIYTRFIENKEFEFSEVFANGGITFLLETLNSYGEITKKYIRDKLDNYVIVPFSKHQHWHMPIVGFRDVFKLKNEGISKDHEKFRRKFYGKTVKKGKWRVKNLEEALKTIIAKPEWGIKLRRDIERPYILPAGNWFRGYGQKGICFFDPKTIEPIKVKCAPNSQYKETIAGKIIDFSVYYSSKSSKNKYLLQCPINITSMNERVRVLLGSIKKDSAKTNAWIKHLEDIGIPEDALNILKTGFNLNVRANLKTRMKLLMVLWLEYRNSWIEFEEWVGKNFNKFEFQKVMDSSSHNLFQYNSKTKKWLFGGKEVLPAFITLYSGKNRFRQDWKKFANLFPSANMLFNVYINELEKGFQNLIIKKVKRKKNTVSTIIANWDVL